MPSPSPEAFHPVAAVPQYGSRERSRWPPDPIVQDIGRKPDVTYDRLKASGLIDQGISYDNNGPKGTKPTVRDTFGAAEPVRLRRGGGERRPGGPPEAQQEGPREVSPEVTPAPTPRQAQVVERPAPTAAVPTPRGAE